MYFDITMNDLRKIYICLQFLAYTQNHQSHNKAENPNYALTYLVQPEKFNP